MIPAKKSLLDWLEHAERSNQNLRNCFVIPRFFLLIAVDIKHALTIILYEYNSPSSPPSTQISSPPNYLSAGQCKSTLNERPKWPTLNSPSSTTTTPMLKSSCGSVYLMTVERITKII